MLEAVNGALAHNNYTEFTLHAEIKVKNMYRSY